ncbi:hypothetical protein BJ322DRAFT_999174 [Thelephora terrestris]|uniref:BTB domain-containing protein n=1 Tax=Thelephora terrestris TaxID=56493 RepID=A0A9P6HLR4_9AGAM|nr:hypothetical protein BJ322DRAFT_999174 [Thelephora terrestris]
MHYYNFNCTDAVLRSLDGEEFPVHRLILGLSSPVFQGMLGLPQPNTNTSKKSTIDLSDPSDTLKPFIQYLYPRSPPKITDISMWAALYAIADKYNAEVVMEPLRDMLIPRFLETHPLRVYAFASQWGFEEEARIASRRTLTMDILNDFPREEAEFMGGAACQQLLFLHFNRREAARAVVGNHPPPSSNSPLCQCPPPNYTCLVLALCQHVATRPWLTAEELYGEVGKWDYPGKCNSTCRNTIKNMSAYFSSLLKGLSDLPQTI